MTYFTPIFALFIFLTPLCFSQLDRVEPPFWWRGMNNNFLQIMAYGENIAKTDISIDSDVVTLQAIHQMSNPNYVFIDVVVADGSDPSSFKIDFQGDNSIIHYDYELRERKEGSANRRGFTNSDVMYLITPDRFANGDPNNDEVDGMIEGVNRAEDFGRHGGDIEGIRQHLDYIKDMGFTAVWLNPVLENNQEKYSYHGYSTTDYYKVDPRFGTNQEYAQMSAEADAMGIKMIMDIIVNHCGSAHWWMNDLPSIDWINGTGKPYVQTNHRKATLLDPYVAPADRRQMVEGWFVPTMPDLNQRNSFMSTYLIQNSIWWIEFAHLAGIRQDTYSYPFREFMTDWTCAIMDEYPNFNIVGEEWVEDPAMISYWQQGKHNEDGYSSCLPSLMDFPMTMALHRALTEEEGWSTGLRELYEVLAKDYLYADPSNLVIFPDNHDMSRIFTQMNEDFDLYKMALTYILTMRGIPQLYYGTEILMANPGSRRHGEIRSDFPGGWTGDLVDAFSNQGLTDQQNEARNFVKKLLLWRADSEVIHKGRLMHYSPANGVYVYFRMLEDDMAMIVLNKNTNPVQLDLDRFDANINGYQAGTDVASGVVYDLGDQLSIPSRASLILQLSR